MYVYYPSNAAALGLASSALLITKKVLPAKLNEPLHELTFGLNYGTRGVWLVSGTTVKLHSRTIKMVDVQHSVKRHAPFHTPLEFLRGAA